MKLISTLALSVVMLLLGISSASAWPDPEPDAEHVTVFQACDSGAAIIELWWKARPDALVQVIDLSYVDNAFQQGTFREELVGSSQSSVVWPGLRSGTSHFVRVAWIYGDAAWAATRTTAFVTPMCESQPVRESTPSPTPSGTSTGNTSTPGETPIEITSTNSFRPGQTARVSAKTTPNIICSIAYTTPEGNDSRAQGLDEKRADSSGNVSWSWMIGTHTKPGTGTVTVTCGNNTVSTSIEILSSPAQIR